MATPSARADVAVDPNLWNSPEGLAVRREILAQTSRAAFDFSPDKPEPITIELRVPLRNYYFLK